MFSIRDIIENADESAPENAIELWVSFDKEKRLPLYKKWKAIAERRGITVIELLDRYNALDYLKRL